MGRRSYLVALLLCAFAARARAATIQGQVQTDTGTGIGSSAVQVHKLETKGWTLWGLQTADASGFYSFIGLPEGSYRIFVVPIGPRAARWYDVQAPTANGRSADAADALILGASTTVTGINTQSGFAGGINGRVRNAGGTYLAGLQVRVQERSSGLDPTTAVTAGGPTPGTFGYGNLPSDNYLFVVYDPNATYQALVMPGPYTVVASSNTSIGDFTVALLATDPQEPNNTRTAAGSSLDSGPLHTIPPTPVVSVGSAIAPRGSDVDWYCFSVVAGDHLLIRAIATVDILGVAVEHPWIDPLIAFRADGTTVSSTADDDGTSKHPRLEVWVDEDAVSCVTVTTYGDTTWTGSGQASAGAYTLRIEQLNRRPVLSELVAPEQVSEGETAVVTFDYVDPDLDSVVVDAVLTDALGVEMPDIDLILGTGDAVVSWNVSQIAATASPYTLTITVSDGTYEDELTTPIDVVAVNVAPPVPILVSPLDGAEETTATPSLLLSVSADDDGDLYDVEIELRYASADASVAQSTTVSASAPSWVPAAIPEDTVVYWRARGNDGEAQSAWSPASAFTVNAVADWPPPAPPEEPDVDDGSGDDDSVAEADGCSATGSETSALLLVCLALVRLALTPAMRSSYRNACARAPGSSPSPSRY